MHVKNVYVSCMNTSLHNFHIHYKCDKKHYFYLYTNMYSSVNPHLVCLLTPCVRRCSSCRQRC